MAREPKLLAKPKSEKQSNAKQRRADRSQDEVSMSGCGLVETEFQQAGLESSSDGTR